MNFSVLISGQTSHMHDLCPAARVSQFSCPPLGMVVVSTGPPRQCMLSHSTSFWDHRHSGFSTCSSFCLETSLQPASCPVPSHGPDLILGDPAFLLSSLLHNCWFFIFRFSFAFSFSLTYVRTDALSRLFAQYYIPNTYSILGNRSEQIIIT